MSSISLVGAVPVFPTALDSARQGIEKGVRSFNQAAQAVASESGQGNGVNPSNLLAGIEARNDVAASAKVFKAADQMIGTLLNLRA